MKKHDPLSIIATAALMSLPLHADDLTSAPFSLRFPASIGHLSFYGDVSALSGASAASKWESSPNPANKGWGFQADYDWRLSGQYNNIDFDNGTTLHFVSETAAIDAGAAGVFRLGLLEATSNTETARGALSLPYEFDLHAIQLSWAKKLCEVFSLGAEVTFSRGETAFKLPAFDFVNTEKDTWGFRLGGLWKPADKWFLGLYGDYINGQADTVLNVPTPLGVLHATGSDTVQQWLIHPGIAYEFKENAMIHADYEAGWVFNDDQTLQLNRWSMGTDIPLMKFLYLRAGAAVDAHSNFSWSTGVGFYPSKHVFIDLAYQNDAFPELKQEFGRSRTLNASIAIQW
jgi:hypothetical protein